MVGELRSTALVEIRMLASVTISNQIWRRQRGEDVSQTLTFPLLVGPGSLHRVWLPWAYAILVLSERGYKEEADIRMLTSVVISN